MSTLDNPRSVRFGWVYYEAQRSAKEAQITFSCEHPDEEVFNYWQEVAYYCWLAGRKYERTIAEQMDAGLRCPYCAEPVEPGDDHVRRGQMVAHRRCCAVEWHREAK